MPGEGGSVRKRFGIARGPERLTIAALDLADPSAVTAWLGNLARDEMESMLSLA